MAGKIKFAGGEQLLPTRDPLNANQHAAEI
jgi:hypothetical protein